MKTLSSLLLVIALASQSSAGLRLAIDPAIDTDAAAPGNNLAAGTTAATLSLQFFNTTGSVANIEAYQTLTYALSTSFFGGSGTAAPTLVSPAVTLTDPGFAVLSPGNFFAAPIGSSVSVPAGGARTIGTLDVVIPSDFLGEFVLISTAGNQFAVTGDDPNNPDDSINFGTTVETLTTVGTGTVVPEPSSFLFLGLVGTGMIGFRRMRRREEELVEAE